MEAGGAGRRDDARVEHVREARLGQHAVGEPVLVLGLRGGEGVGGAGSGLSGWALGGWRLREGAGFRG